MQIAVSHVAEVKRRKTGPSRSNAGANLGHELTDLSGRDAHIKTQLWPMACRLPFARRVPYAPDLAHLPLRLGNDGITDDASFDCFADYALVTIQGALGVIGIHGFDEDIEAVTGCERGFSAQINGTDAIEIRPHDFERRQLRGEAGAGARQQLKHRRVVIDRTESGGNAARLRKQPPHGRSPHAERPFRADEQLSQIITGVVLDSLAQSVDDGAVGEYGFDAQHQVACHAKTQHPVTTSVGRYIVADLTGAATAQIQWKE